MDVVGRTGARLVGVLMIVHAAWGSPPSAHAQSRPAPPASVDERLRRLEEDNRQLREQNRRLLEQFSSLSRRLDARGPAPDTSGGRDTSGTSGAGGGERSGGSDAPDDAADATKPSRLPLKASWGTGPSSNSGLFLETEDGEYRFTFHNQTQLESRTYEQDGQRPTAGGFYVPRQRLIFQGRVTKPVEWEGSVEAAYNTLNLLNAFVNLHYRDELQVKFGRFKVPFQYEYFAISNTDLLQPERSLYGINYGFNRENGFMAFGAAMDERVDYAAGMFNGTRNQRIDFNKDRDFIGYLNARPLRGSGVAWLEHLNLGASVSYGNQANPVVPQALRTSVSQSNNPELAQVAPAWLTFNNGVLEDGDRTQWSLHAAYYYRGLSAIGEAQGGYTHYSAGRAASPRTFVPTRGFYVAAGYFLTGEVLTTRAQVDPLHDFDLRPGRFGLGAWELQARFSELELGDKVFTEGLANRADWSNRAYAVDLGLNWYWNRNMKVYFDWQHSEFGSPVLFAPDRRQLTSDLFWIRCQIYF